MSAVQRQDKSAFASLMARHLDSLYGYAIRLTQEPSNAEDLSAGNLVTRMGECQ